MSVRHINASDPQPQCSDPFASTQMNAVWRKEQEQPPATGHKPGCQSIGRPGCTPILPCDCKQPPATDEWKQYNRKGLSEMRPYVEGEDVSGVSISEPDKQNGSPKTGDMIARNPKNHADQWLVAQKYFEDNLELAQQPPATDADKLRAKLTADALGYEPASDDKPQRPQPDARVEKALRDYDEGLALDSIVTTNSEAYKNGTITPTEQGSHAVGQEQRYEGEAIRKTGQQRPMFNDLTQEWFLNETKIILDLGICQLGFSKNEVTRLKQIVDAHNAALSAHEQAWVKVLNRIADEYAQDMIAAQLELDAEREHVKRLQAAELDSRMSLPNVKRLKHSGYIEIAGEAYNTKDPKEAIAQALEYLRQQLLAAQAAIAERTTLINDVKQAVLSLVSDRLKPTWEAKFNAILKEPDLSALDKHDREQWKLLIDGQNRAICGKCGYPELIGSDDCRNCGTNFDPKTRIEYGHQLMDDLRDETAWKLQFKKELAEVRKPLVEAMRDASNRLREYFAIHKIRGFSKRTAVRCAKERLDDALAKVKFDAKTDRA